MSHFEINIEPSKATVIPNFEHEESTRTEYQSESQLEAEFIQILKNQSYEYLEINNEENLISNLRKQLELLNNYKFTDKEWDNFFKQQLTSNKGIIEKTKIIQDDSTQLLECEDGSEKNIILIDKINLERNKLQIINQYSPNDKKTRYDITILVNGFPLVHIEIKRRGVSIKEAFNQIQRYQEYSFWKDSGLFEYVQIFVISNGTNTKYYSNTTRNNHTSKSSFTNEIKNTKTSNSFEFTSFWSDAKNKRISDLMDFSKTFFLKKTILNILTKYCIFTSNNELLVMRPYQIAATERILNRIELSTKEDKLGCEASGGYIWHTTGSGKTLTSFKTAKLASKLPYIDKVLFVVDRKDLDYQTVKEYDRFEKGAANNNVSTQILQKQLEDEDAKIIVTTIQKLSIFVRRNANHLVFNKHVVIIFDECHRSQFGSMHTVIKQAFKRYHIFGFTGTPIFELNSSHNNDSHFVTTKQVFGDKLHVYMMSNAIDDKNVLPFKVDYMSVNGKIDGINDIAETANDKEKEEFELNPKRIEKITKYILNHFNQKTYRTTSSNNISNIWFNSILATNSIKAAKLYYSEFKKQINIDSAKKLKIALIFSASNNNDYNNNFDDENNESTKDLDKDSFNFLNTAIQDYNKLFQTNFDASDDNFPNYYKDVSYRMKKNEIDLLIVVNMFLTGFDATTLNTLWVDKYLKMHGLVQAFSRTNRILNSVKEYGNIVCFRDLRKETNEAFALFGNENAKEVVFLRSFEDYYYGYEDESGNKKAGYVDLVKNLQNNYPQNSFQLLNENNKKDFIQLFGQILRLSNRLQSFDEFNNESKLLSDADLQDYTSNYLDLKDEFSKKIANSESLLFGENENLNEIDFEIELLEQKEINVDYIVELIKKNKQENNKKDFDENTCKLIKSSSKYRDDLDLFNEYYDQYSDNEIEWDDFILNKEEECLSNIIKSENLKEDETRNYMKDCFENGKFKESGKTIDDIMPKMSLFDSNKHTKKTTIQNKLKEFYEKFIKFKDLNFYSEQEKNY